MEHRKRSRGPRDPRTPRRRPNFSSSSGRGRSFPALGTQSKSGVIAKAGAIPAVPLARSLRIAVTNAVMPASTLEGCGSPVWHTCQMAKFAPRTAQGSLRPAQVTAHGAHRRSMPHAMHGKGNVSRALRRPIGASRPFKARHRDRRRRPGPCVRALVCISVPFALLTGFPAYDQRCTPFPSGADPC